MRFISRLLTIIFLLGLMATAANAQDSLLQYDDLEFTEIIEEQPIQEERTVQTNC
jgi:thiol:disulfide interchange protein DsbD